MAKITSHAGPSPVKLETYDSGGSGRPIVLIHGWPLNGHAWRPQKPALEAAGYRVIAFDRRGFGASDKPDEGYDYDTMAGDVRAIVEELKLEKPVLVGFSMGGGEVARYAGRFGTEGLGAVVFAAAVPPFLLKTADNAEGGLEEAGIKQMKAGLAEDRDGFFNEFATNFYTAGDTLQVEQSVIDNWCSLAADSSTDAALACIDAFSRSDFRDDLGKIDIPTLVIHGDSDSIVPLEVSGQRTAAMVDGADLVVFENGPHGITDSHTDEFNEVLLTFLARL